VTSLVQPVGSLQQPRVPWTCPSRSAKREKDPLTAGLLTAGRAPGHAPTFRLASIRPGAPTAATGPAPDSRPTDHRLAAWRPLVQIAQTGSSGLSPANIMLERSTGTDYHDGGLT
jgi:hypothetical protein